MLNSLGKSGRYTLQNGSLLFSVQSAPCDFFLTPCIVLSKASLLPASFSARSPPLHLQQRRLIASSYSRSPSSTESRARFNVRGVTFVSSAEKSTAIAQKGTGRKVERVGFALFEGNLLPVRRNAGFLGQWRQEEAEDKGEEMEKQVGIDGRYRCHRVYRPTRTASIKNSLVPVWLQG